VSKLTYSEQLRHPLWQRKRLEVLSLSGWACECCSAIDQTLHVHHKRYVKGRMAWEYSRDELAALCETCHQETHHADDVFRDVLAHCPMTGPRSLRSAMAVAAGFIGIHEATPDHLYTPFNDRPVESFAGWTAGQMLETLSIQDIGMFCDALADSVFVADLLQLLKAARQRLDDEVSRDLEGGGN